jgi:hypothetical protein
MNRSQLMNLIVVRGVERSEQLPTPEQLQSKSTKELEEMLDRSLLAEIRAEARAQAAKDPKIVERLRKADEINSEGLWTQFFLKNPELVDNVANRKLLFGYALSLTADGIVKFEHMDEAAKTVSGLARQRVKQPPTAANLKSDEETLQKYCRSNRLESNTAALNLLRQKFGAGFNQAEIAQASQSGLISLGPASEEVLEEIRQEEIEAHNLRLQSMDIPSLRKLAREAGQRGPAAPPLDETQRVRQLERTDVAYPVLPDEFMDSDGNERVLNAEFIKACSKETLRLLLKRYGSAQVNAVLNGGRAGEVWKY